MPSKRGLALLVRMYVQQSSIRMYSNGLTRLASTNENLDYNLVLALAELDCLQSVGSHEYVLSPKGIEIASRPALRVEQASYWTPGSGRGKKTHFWREYSVADRYVEYESACGLSRLSLEVVETPHPKVMTCRDCLRLVQPDSDWGNNAEGLDYDGQDGQD